MLLDRRKFITGSSLALVATGSLGSSKGAFAQFSGGNPQPYSAASAASAIAIGDTYCSTPTGNEWATVSTTMQGMLNDWTANGYDAQLQPYYANITASQFSLSNPNLNLNAMVSYIQQFQPAFTLANLQNALSSLTQLSSTDISSVISTLQTDGLSYYLSQGVTASLQTAMYFGYTPTRPPGPVKPLTPALSGRAKRFPHLETAIYVPGQAHLVRASCKTWTLIGLGVLLVGATIAAGVSGGVLVAAFWPVVVSACTYGGGAITIGSALLNC